MKAILGLHTLIYEKLRVKVTPLIFGIALTKALRARLRDWSLVRAIFSTSGAMGIKATLFCKGARKTLQRYSDVMSFIGRRLRFDLLKTTLIALRGFRGSRLNLLSSPIGPRDLDINLIE